MEAFATEPATCACGSNVRLRALVHLLSLELFGRDLILPEFPKLKAIRGLGLSDKDCYAAPLEAKLDYTNTYYDREPRFDLTETHLNLAGAYDFILMGDVLEHISPPIERALEEACAVLKPNGFLGVTIYCNPSDDMREHFRDLHEYRIVPLGDSSVLINRRRDGTLEIRDDLIFHGGSGATLEMREFGMTALQAKLLAAGFQEIHFLTQNIPEIGVFFDHDVSQPLIARKAPFALDRCAATQLINELCETRDSVWRERRRAEQLASQIRQASEGRWLRLGRKLGVGPRFTP